MNICILLAAGKSLRFGSNKQLYTLPTTGKSVLDTCIQTLVKVVDKVIVVTNDMIHTKNRKVICVPNHIDCRLQSISAGLKYIDRYYSLKTLNIIIHDAARPFITVEHVQNLLKCRTKYSQYCLRLTNGLIYKGTKCVNRDEYMELCTPLCINYMICKKLCTNGVPYEFIDGLVSLKIDYKLIPSSYKHLRKITTIDDIYV